MSDGVFVTDTPPPTPPNCARAFRGGASNSDSPGSNSESSTSDSYASDNDYELCTKSTKRKREEDEQELLAVLLAYTDHVTRVRAANVELQSGCEAIINAYVKHRGGMQELRVFQIPSGARFQEDALCEKTFVLEFRFSHAQMDRVVLALLAAGVPKVIKTRARDKCRLYEALCMMCMKFAWPTRLGSMVRMFGSSVARMSRIIGQFRRTLFNLFCPALAAPRVLPLATLEEFAAAIKVKSGCFNVVGFIDGTVRPVCKPTHLQAACYNGKDRVHALKYQALVTPDGILHQLCGPWPGSRHDMHLLHKSELMAYVRSLPRPAPGNGDMYAVYADCGYAAAPGIQTPYFDAALNAVHEAWNQAMATSRISVEWAFGDIVCYWASTDFRRMQQLLSNRKIAQVYLVAGILTNFMNCLLPGRTSQYFNVSPPTLESYVESLTQRRQAYLNL